MRASLYLRLLVYAIGINVYVLNTHSRKRGKNAKTANGK